MAIIPRYTSRALPPGAQPGLIDDALSRGEAGAGLAKAFGGAVTAGVKYQQRRDKAKADAEQDADGPKMSGKYAGTGTKTGVPFEKNGTAGKSGKVASAKSKLIGRTAAEQERNRKFDNQSGETKLARAEAEITKQRASGYASAKTGGGLAKGLASRALADFDGAAGKLAEGLKNQPHLKFRFDAMVDSSRTPHELRMLTLENERRAGEEKTVLAAALGELAQAATDDPAMAPGVAGRGLAQIESAMDAGMVTPEEAAAMQGEFADNVHMAAMRGQIAQDPALALAKLESAEFNDIFEAPARDRLLGEARTTARVKQAGASAAARARRRGLEIDMEEHLAALDETGAADNAVAARARAELPEIEYAAFQQGQVQSRERHATRAEYAFMTEAEIETDIAQQSPGGGPRDSDERDAAHAIRAETRDEVLAARATDPAGWAMRDEAVAAAFAAAQENPDDPALARQATEQRLALQREMGIEQPRLLSEAERDEIAGQLAQATPADRPTLIADLRARYGQHAGMLAAELTGEVDANTALLIAHAEVPHLPRLIAQGMEKAKKDGPATLTLASPEALNDLPPLPLVETGVPGGYRLDISNLKSGQTYRAPGGAALFYNGEILVPAAVEIAPAATPTGTFGAPDPAPVEFEPIADPTDPNAPTPPLPLTGGAKTRAVGGGRRQFTVPDDADSSPLVRAGYETAESMSENPDRMSTLAPDPNPHAEEAAEASAAGMPTSLLEAFDRADAGDTLEDMGLFPAGYPNPSASVNPFLTAIQKYMNSPPDGQAKMRVGAAFEGEVSANVEEIIEDIKAGSAFAPAVKITKEELDRFNQADRGGIRAASGDDEIVFDLVDGAEFLVLPDDAAAYVIRNWEKYGPRLAFLSKLQDETLSPEEGRRLVEEEVYRDVREAESRGPISPTGGRGAAMLQSKRSNLRRVAEARLQAYDDLVAAMDSGATDEEVAELLENFQQAMLPELLGWGPVIGEVVKDLVPGLSNVRSVIHAWNDLIEIAEEIEEGDVLGLVGNSGMLALDLVGVIPLVGSAATTARTAIKSGAKGTVRALGRTAAGRIASKWMSRRRLAKYLNTATDKLSSKSVEEYFGKVWGDLTPRMQRLLRKRFVYFVGRAGELGMMKEAREAGFEVLDDFDLRKFDLSNMKGGRQFRVFDFMTEQDFKKVWNGVFMAPGKKGDVPFGLDVKVNLSEYLPDQKMADKFLKETSEEIIGSDVLRLPAELIKPEHLADAVEEWMKRSWRKPWPRPQGVPKKEVMALISALQAPGDISVGELFGLVLTYRLSREALRRQREETGNRFDLPDFSDAPG